MNHIATSKEELLNACLQVASKEGLQAVNMRGIAKACGVSVGCVYRYFPSKAELMGATVAKIWEQIFHMAEGCPAPEGFRECVTWVYGCIRSGSDAFPSFYRQHGAGFADGEKGAGRRVMDGYLGHIRGAMRTALATDAAVRQDVFSDDFTREAFVDFVFDNLLTLGGRQAESCDYLIRLIEKLIY